MKRLMLGVVLGVWVGAISAWAQPQGASDLGAWYLFPLVGRDLASMIDPPTGMLRTVGVAQGTQQVLTAYVRDRYYQYSLAPGFLLQFLVDGQPIGPPVGPPYETVWNTAQTPDGTHALSIRVVDRAPGTIVSDPVRPVAVSVVVDNVPGAVAGPQWLPVTGAHIQSYQESGAVDWLSVQGAIRRWNTPAPILVIASPSATTLPDPTVLRAWNQWYAEPLTQPLTTLYNALPELVETGADHPWIRSFYEQKGGSVTHGLVPAFSRRQYDHVDGPRQQNGVDPYSTFIPRPDGPGWWGVDMAGRLFEMAPDGTVTTLHGWRSRRDVLPSDTGITPWEWVGVKGDSGPWLKVPVDLAADPRNPRIVYVADTGNHRIAKVDLTGAVSVVTTFAGVPGTPGYQDGPADQARFNGPYSLVVGADGTIYVADHDNRAIRTISPDGQTVETLVGQGPSGGPTTSQLCSSPGTYTATTPFASATINLPDVLRLDSLGNPVIGEAATGGSIRRLNLETRQVEFLARIGAGCDAWLWLDVDRRGHVGPRDDILVAPLQSNSRMVRVSRTGTIVNDNWQQGWSLLHEWITVDGAQDAFGHYTWTIAIDDTEAKMLAGGIGSSGGVAQFRRYRPGLDPNGYDHMTYRRGIDIWRTGTVAAFPWASRPGFSALHGPTGHSRLGLLTFDELAEWTDSALTAYIQAGMAGTVARPELTGADLKALLYFIRRTSLRGGREAIPIPAPEADRTVPVLAGVTPTRAAPDRVDLTWTTNEATIGVVSYGRGGTLFAASPIEPGYGTAHSMSLPGLPSGVAIDFTITAKDAAGNIATVSGTVPATTGSAVPNAPANLRVQ